MARSIPCMGLEVGEQRVNPGVSTEREHLAKSASIAPPKCPACTRFYFNWCDAVDATSEGTRLLCKDQWWWKQRREGGRTARWEWKDEAFQRRRVESKNLQGKAISRGRQNFIGIGPFYVKLWKQVKICVCTLLPQRLVIGLVTSDI